MRMIMHVHLPHEPFNSFVADGTAGEKISRVLEAVRPEAVYFTEQDGKRGAIVVVDVKDASSIPSLCEPFFMTFNADVELRVAMTPDDLSRAGLGSLGETWG